MTWKSVKQQYGSLILAENHPVSTCKFQKEAYTCGDRILNVWRLLGPVTAPSEARGNCSYRLAFPDKATISPSRTFAAGC